MSFKDVAGPPGVQVGTFPSDRGNDCSYVYAVAAALFILGALNPLPNMDLLVSPGNQDGSRERISGDGWNNYFLYFEKVLHFSGWKSWDNFIDVWEAEVFGFGGADPQITFRIWIAFWDLNYAPCLCI